MPPSIAESSQPDPQDDKSPEMPRFRWSPPPADPSVRRAPASVPANSNRAPVPVRKPEALSSPLPWPPTQVQELNKRRMLLQEEREKRSTTAPPPAEMTAEEPVRSTHETSAPLEAEIKTSTAPLVSSVPPAQAVPAISLSSRVAAIAGSGSRRAQSLMRTSRRWASEKQSGFASGITALRERIRDASRAAALARTMRAVSAKSECNESAPSQPAVPNTFEAASSGAPGARPISSRFRDGGAAGRARQLWARSVVVAVSARKQIQGAATRVSSVRDDAAARLRKNERLATSMSMAALSSLLALGLIVAIRHNPSASGPVRSVSLENVAAQEKSLAQPAATVNSTSDSVKAADAVDTTGAPGKPDARMSIVTPASLTVSRKNTRAGKVAARRSHRNADEDYVAPDTYVVIRRH